MRPRIVPLGDSALVIQWKEEISEEIHQSVLRLARTLEEDPFPGMVETVPGIASLTIHYDPVAIIRGNIHLSSVSSAYEWVTRHIEQKCRMAQETEEVPTRVIEIPVCYGGEYGPDLSEVAHTHGLTEEEVIRLHTAPVYTVYMIGFAPGFPYLGGLSSRLYTPRRSTPRLQVPAGTVGIGGAQTGIYPIASPGGWHCIGRTPVALFRKDQNPPSLLRAGDRVRFFAIEPEAFYSYDQKESQS